MSHTFGDTRGRRKSPSAPPPSLDTLKQRALEGRADLKTARLEEEQESAGVALAKAEASRT